MLEIKHNQEFHNILTPACALGGSLLAAAAPASGSHLSGGTAQPAATGRLLPETAITGRDTGRWSSQRATGHRTGYGYLAGYGYPYRYGYRVGYGYPHRRLRR